MHTAPLTQGDRLPPLELFQGNGQAADLETLTRADWAVLYFMRTATCPVCHAHLRKIKGTAAVHGLDQRVIVVVPGAPADAAHVERRHPELGGRVLASPTAHASVGLFVRGGLQQSGTLVVDPAGVVVSARISTVPIGAYDEEEVLNALAASRGRAAG